VCPTGAIFFGTYAELVADRPKAQAVDVFGFGEAVIQTGCAVVVPAVKEHSVVPTGYE